MRILGTSRGNHASVKPTPGPRPARKADPMNANQAARQQAEAELGIGILVRAIDPNQTPNDLVARMAEMAVVHLVAAARIAAGHQVCPGCSGLGLLSDDPQVLRCQGCGGVFTNPAEPITEQQAFQVVAIHLPMLANAGPDGSFMFDLNVVTDWKGPRVARLHGWADRKTKRVVQWG
jgi:hypothetical protein